MSSNTPNLGLLKKDPITDGNDTFNIKTMMNDNWDKLDGAVGQIRDDIQNIDVDIPDASLTQQGISQLNSAVDSMSETQAATPKAIKTVNDSLVSHKADETYQVASGTATALIVPMATLVNGYSKTFIASATSTSTAKTINGKPFYKPGTTVSPSLVIGKAYTVWYDSTSDYFFIKASAEGTATSAQVLAGTSFSNDADTGVLGLMNNRAGDTPSLTSSVVGTTLKLRASDGYRDGIDDNVTITDANFIANNIRRGISVLGLTGVADTPTTVTPNKQAGRNHEWAINSNKTIFGVDSQYVYYMGGNSSFFTIEKYDFVGNLIKSVSLPKVTTPGNAGQGYAEKRLPGRTAFVMSWNEYVAASGSWVDQSTRIYDYNLSLLSKLPANIFDALASNAQAGIVTEDRVIYVSSQSFSPIKVYNHAGVLLNSINTAGGSDTWTDSWFNPSDKLTCAVKFNADGDVIIFGNTDGVYTFRNGAGVIPLYTEKVLRNSFIGVKL